MKLAATLLVVFCLSGLFTARALADQYSFGVRITGHGKPMLLIPGFKGSADTYNDVVAHYKDHYKCYVLTLAGFAGQPPSGTHDHLLQQQRDEIIQYIIHEHLDHPVIVGFSFGGVLATWIATTRPDLAGPLIDIDGTPFDIALQSQNLNKDSLIKDHEARYARVVDQTPAFWKKRDSLFHSPMGMKLGDESLRKLVTDSSRIKEIEAWDAVSDFRSASLMDLETDTVDMRQSVANLQRPILVLGSWVSWDYKFKSDAEKDYADKWKNAKNVTMVFSDKGKHFLMYDDLGWMLAQMDTFLKKYN
jgi:N-formylmaleamate deformylase